MKLAKMIFMVMILLSITEKSYSKQQSNDFSPLGCHFKPGYYLLNIQNKNGEMIIHVEISEENVTYYRTIDKFFVKNKLTLLAECEFELTTIEITDPILKGIDWIGNKTRYQVIDVKNNNYIYKSIKDNKTTQLTFKSIKFPHLTKNLNDDYSKIYFGNDAFLYRWSTDLQYKFTPLTQNEKDNWIEMISFSFHPKIISSNQLALQAMATTLIYANEGRKILRTYSIPKINDKPEEHFISSILIKKNLIEYSASRFLIKDGIGTLIVYSRRFTGKKIENEFMVLLDDIDIVYDNKLMSFDIIPSYDILKSKENKL